MRDNFNPNVDVVTKVLQILGSILLIAFLFLMYTFMGRPHEVVVEKQQAAVADLKTQLLHQVQADAERQAEAEVEERARQRLPWTRLLDRVAHAEAVRNEAADNYTTLGTKRHQLMVSPQGRNIATDEARVAVFRANTQDDEGQFRKLAELQNEFLEMSIQARTSSNGDTTTAPNEQLVASIERIIQQASTMERKSSANLAKIDAEMAVSSGSTGTLQTAISSAARREDDEQVKAEAAAIAKLRAIEMDKAVESRVAAEKERLDAERLLEAQRHQKLLGEIEARRQNEKIEADRVRQANIDAERMAEEDRAMRADLDRIRSVLTPFISKASVQITANNQRVATENPQPASWAAIQGSKALDPTSRYYWRSFVNALVSAGREKGATPTDEYDYEGVGKAQLLLKKHADAMIRAGLLVP